MLDSGVAVLEPESGERAAAVLRLQVQLAQLGGQLLVRAVTAALRAQQDGARRLGRVRKNQS